VSAKGTDIRWRDAHGQVNAHWCLVCQVFDSTRMVHDGFFRSNRSAENGRQSHSFIAAMVSRPASRRHAHGRFFGRIDLPDEVRDGQALGRRADAGIVARPMYRTMAVRTQTSRSGSAGSLG
jgi:hypothetical protein